MKGNASSVGAHGLSELTHAAEDVDRGSPPAHAAGDRHGGLAAPRDGRLGAPPARGDGRRRGQPPGSTSLPAGVLFERLRNARRAEREGAPSTSKGATSIAADEGDRGSGAEDPSASRSRSSIAWSISSARSRSPRNRIARGSSCPGGAVGAALRDGLEELDRLNTKLEEAIRRARIVPVGPGSGSTARRARLARSHGKLARLVVVHGDVEVDTAVIERLRDVLTHLVRNGIDHGLEPPEVRKACGKDPRGTITLRAAHEAAASRSASPTTARE